MIGLSTYALFWQHSERAIRALDLDNMLDITAGLGGEVFQICDYQKILSYTPEQLARLKAKAADLNITLELGTKGILPEVLTPYLQIAEVLGAKLIRSMLTAPNHRPALAEAETLLRNQLGAFATSGVTLALETYEQVGSQDLVSLVETLGSDHLGICLDPANCVARLEHPKDVIDRCAPYVKNLHIKDFAFTRRGGWVGFTLEGAELGTGLLPYEYMIDKVSPDTRGINRVLEHWLTWRDDFEQTRETENNWNTANLAYMRRIDQQRS